MTSDEAELAAGCGAQGIVVSNHGGRALDHTPGVADVLREVAKSVKGELIVLADGGVRAGIDVLKFLALGADAVLIGRPFAIGAFGGGRDGVRCILDTLRNELEVAMILTGCASLRDIGPHVLASPWNRTLHRESDVSPERLRKCGDQLDQSLTDDLK